MGAAGLFVASASFLGILAGILVPNQLKATEILTVVATPCLVLSGHTRPLSQMPEAVPGQQTSFRRRIS
ncbi:ABC transporter permease [Methylocaldum szegediense]|uniref:ABC-2 type transporter transmembrane domain-containing protein n=1 Tax=Methylocaldum szegediense TaxID=73780 RepID=A0ABN8X1P3_9GAMM|nr:ABC transporter permease [Methylocaldum szegediense]CAI8727450.1 protein of unknown function [Methylocaldum szegediense]